MPVLPRVRGTPDLRRRRECWGRRWWRAPRRRRPLRGLQIRLERVDGYLHRRIGVRPPQLRAVEHDGVEPLRVFAGLVRRRVGIDAAAEIELDRADMAAHIAWQPRVCGGMNVFRE